MLGKCSKLLRKCSIFCWVNEANLGNEENFWGNAQKVKCSTPFKCCFNFLSKKMQSYICGICLAFFPLCIIKCLLKVPAREETKSQWLLLFSFFSSVCFEMCPQSACLWKVKITLVAFIQLFFTVCFQLFLQIACHIRCKVT